MKFLTETYQGWRMSRLRRGGAMLAALSGLAGGLVFPAIVNKQAMAQTPQPPTIEPEGGLGFGRRAARDIAEASPLPAMPQGVERLLSASYLAPDEAKTKRVFFGRYTAADLDTPLRAARAALVRGVYDDPALQLEAADPLDRAEAALRRGELARAMTLAETESVKQSARATRIRAESLEQQGKYIEAADMAEGYVAKLVGRQVSDPEQLVEAVRLTALRTRIRGPLKENAAAADYQAMMQMLGELRAKVDRLYWPAALAEAELLYAKDNRGEAVKAIEQVLELNPTCAEAWALLGRVTVDGFNFGATEQIARRLHLLASPEFDIDASDDIAPGVSAYGAALIARAMLRQSEGQQALEALLPALARSPSSPMLLALKCAAEAVRFDFAACSACLAQFDGSFGASADAHLETGKALSEARQYEKSAAHLRQAHERQPNDPRPLIELGMMQMQAGDDKAALAALEKSFALDPFNVRADNTLRLARELQTYESIETEHFVFRFKPGPHKGGGAGDELLAREMGPIMERNHAIVTAPAERGPTGHKGGVDHVPAKKTIIDIMPDHQWFGVRIAGMPQIHTIAASTGPVIAMESPREGPNHLGTYDWVRVLRHEYVHTVTLSRTNNRIPHWFTEASAVYLELAPRDYPTMRLLAAALERGKLFDFSYINLAFVRPRKPTDRSQAYAQGHWMYEFIIERFGARAPLSLMDKYAEGVREEEAFTRVLGIGREEFFKQFVIWARTQVEAWGLSVPDEMPTLRMLLAREALKNEKLEPHEKKVLELIAASRSPVVPEAPEGEKPLDLDGADLPEPTPAMVESWRQAYPMHPDVLELAVDDAVRANSKPGRAGMATLEMLPLMQQYATARPSDPKPHRLMAQLFLLEGENDPSKLVEQASKAIPHLEFLDLREQKEPAYAMALAQRYAALGDYSKATSKAERATQLSPFDPRPREVAATVYLQARDLANAERHLLAVSQIEPTREIHKQRLEALRRMKP